MPLVVEVPVIETFDLFLLSESQIKVNSTGVVSEAFSFMIIPAMLALTKSG